MMVRPQLTTLLLCEAMAVGPGERKTLYGLIDRIVHPQYPAYLERSTIFGRFAYGDGTFDIRFLIRGPEDKLIFDGGRPAQIQLDDMLQRADLSLELKNLRLPCPGSYWIEAWCGEEKFPLVHPLYVDLGRA